MVDSQSSLSSSIIRTLCDNCKILLFGQVLSFTLACAGAAQSALALDCNLSAPTFTIGLYYFGLMFCLFFVKSNDISTQEKKQSSVFLGCIPVKGPIWGYFVMAAVDVYANYFTVLAFKYTTITSVTLFDALAIPTAMILSCAFLGRKYQTLHYLGVFCCCVGVTLNVFQDYEDDEILEEAYTDLNETGLTNLDEEEIEELEIADDYPHKLTGDMLAIMGGLLFGLSNVLGEYAVRSFGGPMEFLGMVGFFGTCICIVQTILLEREKVAEFYGAGPNHEESDATCSKSVSWLLLIAFWISTMITYIGTAKFLTISEAAFYNLSLLTGDLWSVTFAILAESLMPKPLFFFALFITVSGVVVYEMAPSPVGEGHTKDQKGEESEDHDLAMTTTQDDRQIT